MMYEGFMAGYACLLYTVLIGWHSFIHSFIYSTFEVTVINVLLASQSGLFVSLLLSLLKITKNETKRNKRKQKHVWTSTKGHST